RGRDYLLHLRADGIRHRNCSCRHLTGPWRRRLRDPRRRREHDRDRNNCSAHHEAMTHLYESFQVISSQRLWILPNCSSRIQMTDDRHRRLLRVRRERPCRCRAAEERDELAALDCCNHSITSSAIASTPGGIVTPSVLAVLRLITSSNLV